MAIREEQFGKDLKLLSNLEHQHDRDVGRDLHAVKRPETGLMDLERLEGVDDLRQALLLRFLTQQGELTALGHPRYGSRLNELIGELNTETNRNRAKLFALQAIQDEPRIAEVLSATVITNRADPNRIDIDLSLLAIESDVPVNLVFPFFLDTGTVS